MNSVGVDDGHVKIRPTLNTRTVQYDTQIICLNV